MKIFYRSFVETFIGFMFCVLTSVFISSCVFLSDECPVLIYDANVKTGVVEKEQYIAGAVFNCVNTTDRDVEELVVAFDLFCSSEKGKVFIKHFEASFSEYFEAGTEKEFVVCLDSALGGRTNESYFISNFYVKKIVFDDGSEYLREGVFYA